MQREARTLAALRSTDVPHPRLIAACDDPEVLGAAFYLMEPVAGANPTVTLPLPYLNSGEWRRQLGLAMADGAAAVGAVDYVGLGLSDLGKPEGFLERQVARWQSQLDSYSDYEGYAGPDIPDLEEVGLWLDSNRPTRWRAGLIHGDYHFANVMCGFERPVIVAIIDWELTTIGDPLLDLGWMLATWPGPEGPIAGNAVPKPWDGFPTARDVIARYAERSDRDLSAVSWYLVLACYKLGIILEGTYARSCSGQASMVLGTRLHARTLELFSRARAAIRSG
jgi:aminoglycoside phosphotransferase (APT) family kinase protein